MKKHKACEAAYRNFLFKKLNYVHTAVHKCKKLRIKIGNKYLNINYIGKLKKKTRVIKYSHFYNVFTHCILQK